MTPMTRAEVVEHVTRKMTEMFEIEPGALRLDAKLREELDLDSIDAIDLAVELQSLTGRRVEESVIRKLRTVCDVVDLVESELRSGRG
jgi:acyl carrier protein